MRNTGNLKFEIYCPYNKNLNKPVISISKSGASFNKYCKQFFQKKPYVRLYYCRDKRVIAIEPYHLITEHTLNISKLTHQDSNPKLSCKRFLAENNILPLLKIGIDDKKSEKFIAEWDEKNLCFMIHLKDGVGRK